MRIIRAETHRVMPWKNGGGTTREIAVFPEGADTGEFLWRLSIATVSTSGPFSRFEGVDRTIACLEGGGMRLALGDGRVLMLKPGAEPFAFAGEAEVSADCLGGETIDLNAMARRSRFRHAMVRIVIEQERSLIPDGDTAAIVFLGAAEIVADQRHEQARRFDCAVIGGRRLPIRIIPSGRLEIFLVSFWQLGGTGDGSAPDHAGADS